jgi:hypothetical protein
LASAGFPRACLSPGGHGDHGFQGKIGYSGGAIRVPFQSKASTFVKLSEEALAEVGDAVDRESIHLLATRLERHSGSGKGGTYRVCLGLPSLLTAMW